MFDILPRSTVMVQQLFTHREGCRNVLATVFEVLSQLDPREHTLSFVK